MYIAFRICSCILFQDCEKTKEKGACSVSGTYCAAQELCGVWAVVGLE